MHKPFSNKILYKMMRVSNRIFTLLTIITAIWIGCGDRTDDRLPFLGDTVIENGDTIYYTIPAFDYINQDSVHVTNETLAGKPYVADFFFTSCPTICPKVKSQMIRLHDLLGPDHSVTYLSMSIDYRKDSVPILKRYVDKLEIEDDHWHFVQLKKDQIESVANQYFNIAFEDESAPGGFDHSGRLILVDGKGRIRSHCNGTDPESVDQFANDIRMLLNEG